MTVLNWVGGGTNQLDNPADWNPAQAPTANDTPIISGGTFSVTGDPLHGGTVYVYDVDPPAVNGPVTFNITGNALLDENMVVPTAAHSPITFNLLGNDAVYTGGFGSDLSPVNVTGQGTFQNVLSGINGAAAKIEPNVTGTGQFYALASHGKNGSLEFMGSVSAGQTIDVHGDATNNTFGTLVIDKPADFSGKINLGLGDVLLAGVQADGFSYTNDVLKLTSGGTEVDSLRLTQAADTAGGPNPLTVTQTSGGTLISAHGGTTPLVTMPPIATANF